MATPAWLILQKGFSATVALGCPRHDLGGRARAAGRGGRAQRAANVDPPGVGDGLCPPYPDLHEPRPRAETIARFSALRHPQGRRPS